MPFSARPLLTVVGVVLILLWQTAVARADLASYLAKPEPKFAWKVENKTEEALGTIYTIGMVSQTWQEIVWEHKIQVFIPKNSKPSATMLLWNTGGLPNLRNTIFGMAVAAKVQAPVAILYGVPNQPLFDKSEDALIAETFVRALETKDFDWPLLFPMVKSVIKAMDAIQAFAKKDLDTDVTHFVVAGGSKRGWTSWLTGASGDKRVKAIIPVVIDTLNMQEQLAHQKKSFGDYSLMIQDYTKRKLIPLPPGDDARKLWLMVDPYTYRDKLTMPKLIINGNNDPYWTVDALNLYWDGLKGDKWICYVPNAGHTLEQKDPKHPDAEGDRTRVLNAISAFVRAQSTNQAFPQLQWQSGDTAKEASITLESSTPPRATRVWSADSATPDFRLSEWKESPTSKTEKGVMGAVALPKEGCRVFYVEAEYELDGIRYTLSTQVRVLQAK